jgi:hypothetical protein
MKWTMIELGLIPPLTWAEGILLLCVLGLVIFAGWVVIQCFRLLYDRNKVD